MVERIAELRREAEAAIGAAADPGALEELRVRYLGRRSELTRILRGIAELPEHERGPVGKAGNEARDAIEALLAARQDELGALELEARLESDAVDVTLPGTPAVPAGSRNLLLRTQRQIEDVFVGLGYRVMEGPEVELDYYNFTALNHPPGHPARMEQDTFYVDPQSLARDPVPAGALPLHGAKRGGRCLLLPLQWLGPSGRRGPRPAVQGHGLDRDPRLRDGRSERVRLRAGARLRPGAGPGLRLRHGDRADRDAEARRARPAQVLRERRAGAGAVPMRIPYTWLRGYCDPGLTVEELAERIALRTTEVERISYVGPPSREGFVVGRVLSVARPPAADRLTVCEVETGDATRTIVCGAPNVAAGQTVPVALPGAVMPGGEKLGRAEPRGVTSDGMILSEVELQIGDDSAGIAVLDDGASPGTPLSEVLPLAE